jgi:endogenous inhibitor of DNA gyrase (YacG/DUF329 family)
MPRSGGILVDTPCKQCGKPFRRYACQKRTYCCWECKCAAERTGAKKTTACPACGKMFSWYQSWPRTYCSKACSGTKTVVNIKHFKPSRYTTDCETCGKEFTTTPKTSRGRFCSLKCFGRYQSLTNTGPRHPLWMGGYDPYYGPSWREARRQARARDGVCRDCGASPTDLGYQLHVHHLVPFKAFGIERHEEANDLANLVSICNPCHGARANDDVAYWKANGKPDFAIGP